MTSPNKRQTKTRLNGGPLFWPKNTHEEWQIKLSTHTHTQTQAPVCVGKGLDLRTVCPRTLYQQFSVFWVGVWEGVWECVLATRHCKTH